MRMKGLMAFQWIELVERRLTDEGSFRAGFSFPAGSPWFSGHFPQAPVLPGIALLAAAVESVRSFSEMRGSRVEITAIKRIRFKQLIGPNTPMRIEVLSDRDPLRYRFKIVARDDQTVCSGFVTVAPSPEDRTSSQKPP